jgi:transposase
VISVTGLDQIEHLATELDWISPWHDDLLIISARDSSTPPARSPGQTKRVAFGITNWTNYRTRALLYAGRPNWSLLETQG